VSFGFEDSTVLDSEARDAAWLDARRKAEQLAELSGLVLGRPVAIAEQVHAIPGPAMTAMTMEAASATPIEAGESAVSVTIDVQFGV
jgi:uncharacterized protein YggE